MKITSKGINNGVFDDKYGVRGTQVNSYGVPSCSFPFMIEDAPANTKSYAIVLEDKDAYPVSGGFVWIHWLAANIKKNELQENESINATDFIQGSNSWTSMQGGQLPKEATCFYGGMMPPDQAHLYELHVYALDSELDLENGFLFNELHHAMDGHILECATLKGLYNN
ncbi:YbhB/YbcL family Raf kinase inhibitor-like protein [Anaerorhabdus sp.]|uniref:YbhB/YbcL family Raf kinase inhibitor-like protein n=1 Tax=Anaerorhabdus sp. TaxID=1872524 RepID=UPI002FCBD220